MIFIIVIFNDIQGNSTFFFFFFASIQISPTEQFCVLKYQLTHTKRISRLLSLELLAFPHHYHSSFPYGK